MTARGRRKMAALRALALIDNHDFILGRLPS